MHDTLVVSNKHGWHIYRSQEEHLFCDGIRRGAEDFRSSNFSANSLLSLGTVGGQII